MSDPTSKDDDPAFAAKLEEYRQRAAARVAEIRGAILAWLKRLCFTLCGMRSLTASS